MDENVLKIALRIKVKNVDSEVQIACPLETMLFQIPVKKDMKDDHICLPVSVCVKNHTNAATKAVIAMMTIAIGLAERTALNIPKAPLAPIVAAVWVASATVNAPD